MPRSRSINLSSTIKIRINWINSLYSLISTLLLIWYYLNRKHYLYQYSIEVILRNSFKPNLKKYLNNSKNSKQIFS